MYMYDAGFADKPVIDVTVLCLLTSDVTLVNVYPTTFYVMEILTVPTNQTRLPRTKTAGRESVTTMSSSVATETAYRKDGVYSQTVCANLCALSKA